jgi:alkanesulfonate monooxygenase SsuD/methylene tetrahydromethanopterin reductase-like flavin-dependent oxidoreductase (luciferase family)
MRQYEPFFDAHGFGREARRLQAHARSHDLLAHASLVPDEMVRTFVLCGAPEKVQERVERAWSVADSLCLVPPFYALAPERVAGYGAEIARLFYH